MTEAVIERPDPAGIAQAEALARRWLPAFLAGRRAPEDVYADAVSTWHNTGEWEAAIERTPSRARRVADGADLRVEDVRVRIFDGGWVVQSRTVGTNPEGEPVRIASCLVVTVRDGRIARFEEYADSRATDALFAAGG
ncbi:SnoaL-like protein [Mumia flava]|uniref:SnoaL-like protein n=1 Tax=Mumia flava TaxID=1348852 RepID=A0A2M9BE08_9ACTN|nr:nuclear transport factor 2 family protein [Mumia flava]PJJ56124.1 SnoaL-like protein [Mumia flava]